MIAKSINNVFDQQQRQSLVINASASMVAVLLLALLSLVVFIMIRGSTYFWPLEIYTITYTQSASQTKQQSFAQARGLSEKVTLETSGRLAKDINQELAA